MTTPTEPLDAPAPAETDSKARVADGKPLVTNPEAPFGYMTDPASGEVRPRKRPGRQRKADPKPPPTHKARAAKPPADPGPARDFTQAAGELMTGVWMMFPPLAGLPMVPDAISVRLKAQAAILKANIPNLAVALNMGAQHNETIAKIVTASTSGEAAWLLPAMGAVIPFAAMSATMWRAPVEGDVTGLAAATDAEWDALVKAMMNAAQAAGGSSDGDSSAAG